MKTFRIQIGRKLESFWHIFYMLHITPFLVIAWGNFMVIRKNKPPVEFNK